MAEFFVLSYQPPGNQIRHFISLAFCATQLQKYLREEGVKGREKSGGVREGRKKLDRKIQERVKRMLDSTVVTDSNEAQF